MKKSFIPYGKQEITLADERAVLKVLRSDFLTTGPRVDEFEKVFATYSGAGHAIAVANGTAALHLAALALGIGPDDTVLAPTMSFVASANGARYAGANIEFMDCDPKTGLVTADTFSQAADEALKTGRLVKLAVIVHLNGEPADMAAIYYEADKRGIALVEDACHALGSRFSGANNEIHKVGDCRYSKMCCYSFHPVKTITTGEGGVITTADPLLARKLELLRSHGISRESEDFKNSDLAFDDNGAVNPWYYEMQSLGFNYRLSDIACALGTSQMSRIEQIALRRRELKTLYDGLFANSNLPMVPIVTPTGNDPVRHLYPVLMDYEKLGISRSAFVRELKEQGIGSQVHYIPIHCQPYYRSLNPNLTLCGAENYYRDVLSLPLFPSMENGDIERVVKALQRVFTLLTNN